MARDVEFNVTASDKTGTALAAAEAKFKATQDRIKQESGKASDSLTRMGDAGAKSVTKLQRELKVAESDLKGLAAAFANAGSASERIDITKNIRKQNAEINNLRRVLKSLGDDDGGLGDGLVKGVGKAAPGILDKLKNTFGLAGTSGGQLLAIGVAAAAPLIGATVSAAVIGAAGAGGMIGGAYLAARDPRVKSAGTELGKNLLGQLERDAAPFVDPLLKNITKVEVRFGQMNDRIKNIFSNSSGFLDPLVDGALAGIGGILRGVDSLVAKGKPVIDAFGRTFTDLGQATGDAFELISGGSDEAADALGDITKVLSFLIVGTGATIRYLTELYGVITFIPRKVYELEQAMGLLEKETAAVGTTASAAAAVHKTMATIILSAGEAAGTAGLQMQTYADQMNDAAEKGRSLYDSQTSVAQAVANAKKALEENGKTLKLNSQEGRDNRTALSGVAAALQANYNAYVKVNGEGRGAQAVAEANRKKFIELATSFGKGKTEAERLATQMGLLKPKTINFHANTHDAEARIKALQGKIASTKGKTVSVSVIVNDARLRSVENRLSRLHGSSAFDAGAHWAAFDANSGVARTGGSVPVSVSNSFDVYLNGVATTQTVVQIVERRSERDAWRQKVGRR